MTNPAGRFFAPLRHRRLALLFAGQVTSNVGDAVYAVALPWYVLATHGGALLLGVVLAAYGVPRTALLVVGGHLADRWRPWTVMLAADTVRMAVVAGLAAMAFAGPARAATLVPIAVVLGAGEGLFLPGALSIVPSLVPGEILQSANALTSSGSQMATLAGPILGGALVGAVSPGGAFAVDAATFAASAATLLAIRRTRAAPAAAAAPPAPGQPDAAPAPPAGIGALLRRSRVLQVILLITIAANLGSGGFGEVALPALAHGPLGAGATGYGALMAAMGAGALVGTLVAGTMGTPKRVAVVASAAFMIQSIFGAIVPYLGSVAPAAASLALFGVCNGFGNVLTITAFQRWAPPALLGRIMGILMTASFAAFPISVAAAGVLVHRFGPAPFFPLASAAVILAIAAGLTQREWREFGRNEAAAAAAT
ncbi:MAG TPA: MFS transporter [Acidimicrobiales bacterium]|nr:MFS transporter [Acidimicrobiales bacterium]